MLYDVLFVYSLYINTAVLPFKSSRFKLQSEISFSLVIFVYVGVNVFVSLCRQLNLKKVLVSGGHLDYRVNPQHLKENGGLRIYILALDQAGRVSCFSSSPHSIAAPG